MNAKSFIAILLLLPLLVVTGQGDSSLIPMQREGKWGYVDASGNFVIAPAFDQASVFSEGLAAIAVKTVPMGSHDRPDQFFTLDKWGFINKKGEIVIQPKYSSVGDFSEGLARVKVDDKIEALWGFINTKGEMIISPQFAYAEDFKNGRAVVGLGKLKAKSVGKHTSTISLTFHGKKGFIDKEGRFTRKLD